MSIHEYETPSGARRWRVMWRSPTTGRQRSKSFDDEHEAMRYELQVHDALEVARGGPVAPSPRLEQWATTWLKLVGARVKAGQLAAKTAVGYENVVRLHLLPALGHVRVDELKVSHVNGWLTDLTARRSAGTARHARATLSAMLSAAQDDELVERNVAQLARPPKVTLPEVSTFTPEEMAAITYGCQTARHGRLWLWLAETGTRASEALGLQWDDVDLDDARYRIAAGLHRVSHTAAAHLGITGGLVRAEQTKTERSADATPMSAAAAELLRQQRVAQAADQLAATVWVDTGAVWHSTVGTHATYANVMRDWRDMLDDVGVPYRTPDGRGRGMHELRRTWATQMLDGTPLKIVQRLGRWATPAMLLSRYAGSDEQRLRDALDRRHA